MEKIEAYKVLLQALLPEELFNSFELKDVQVHEDKLDVHLDEQNIQPEGYTTEELISKGFYDPIQILDFPIRDRAVFLHIRCRKWQVVSTKKIISKNWDLMAKGTHYTKSLASFLKEAHGYIPGKQ